MLGIVGSGFGLYGYLPAIIGVVGEHVVLPQRYRRRFDMRPELASFGEGIEWVADEEAVISLVDGIVLALPPGIQAATVQKYLDRPNVERLVLEKPLAATPRTARQIHERLSASGKIFRISYLFRHTAWGNQFLAGVGNWQRSSRISIRWSFLAHHYRHDVVNWKRFNNQGGGALRFYGIHILALLAEAGYTTVTGSKGFGQALGETERWVATFEGRGLPPCELAVDTRNDVERFAMHVAVGDGSMATIVDLAGPFGEAAVGSQPGSLDVRIPVLADLCVSMRGSERGPLQWYERVITLWHDAEVKLNADE